MEVENYDYLCDVSVAEVSGLRRKRLYKLDLWVLRRPETSATGFICI